MKRFLTGLLAIALLTSLLFTSASAASRQKSGNFSYEIKGNGTAKIVGYSGDNDEDIYIPSMLDGYTVTEIGEKAFEDLGSAPWGQKGITVIIPETITVIGEKAFFDSGIIQTINIPASVKEIGPGAFAGMNSDLLITVASGNDTFATIDGILYNKKIKELVCCPTGMGSVTIPEGIVSIGEYAFYEAQNPVTFPSTLTTIDSYAFYGAEGNDNLSVNALILPESLTTIGDYAFYNVGYWFPTAAEPKERVLYIPKGVTHIGEGAFMDVDDYKLLDLHDCSITEIPANAFKEGGGMYDRVGIIWPKNLQIIGENAFEDFAVKVSFASCTKGKENGIEFPNTLREIKNNAFAEVFYNGNVVTLPEGLETLGRSVFIGDSNMPGYDIEKIILPSSLTSIGENLCNRSGIVLQVTPGSYAEHWASENGYVTDGGNSDDTSWLNN